MNTIQTKLLKEEIYTNKVITNDVNADEIYMKGYKLSDVLVSQTSVTSDSISTNELFGGQSNAVRYRAFEMNPKSYVEKYLGKIILYNTTGLALQSSDLTYNTDAWLFVDCIHNIVDEQGNKIGEEIVDTFFSINAARQGQNITETTWQFTPLYIKEEYDILRFRGTKTKGVADRPTTTNSVNAFLTKKTRTYGGEGWNTFNQNSNTPNTTGETATFGFELSTVVSGMSVHVADDTIHTTTEFKNDVLSHISNDDIHITLDEREKLSNLNLSTESQLKAHVEYQGLHWTPTDRVQFNSVKSHTSNTSLHLSATDRENINRVNSTLISVDKIIDNAIEKVQKRITEEGYGIIYQQKDITENSTGTTDVQGIAFAQICPKHTFDEGSKLRLITIEQPQVTPASGEWTDDSNAIGGIKGFYLALHGDTTGNDNFELIECSSNKCEQIPNGNPMTFVFSGTKDLGLYKKFRIFYVRYQTEAKEMPEQSNEFTGIKMAFRAGTGGDNQDCGVWQTKPSAGVFNRTIPATFTYTTYGHGTIDHKDNVDRHVSADYKAMLDAHIADESIHFPLSGDIPDNISEQLDVIKSNLSNVTTKVSDLESTVADNSKVEAINEALNIDSGEYYRYSFDTPISSDYANDKENLATQMIRFGKSHFPTGRITEIELPYEYGKSNLTVYLAVQVVKKDESKDVVKTAAETVYSSNVQSQSYRAKGTSVFKFDNLIIPDDYQYVRLAFVPNTSTVPTYNGSNCTTYGITVVDLVSDTDSCRLITDGFESRYGAQCRVKYAKSHVIQQLGSEITNVESNVTAVDSKIANHIGDASHLTDAQKSSISQISTISSDLNTHKTNGGTLHVTSDEKSKWSGHVDNNSLHVSATYKQDITNAIASFEQHKSDEDIHFSKSEIMDNVAGSLETWDMSLGASVKGAQGIAYAQICNTHVLQQGSYLTKITVPQHTNPQASEVTTGVDLYLVIFGDNEDSASSDETKWEFVACSTNEGQQQIGGNSNTKPDMVFEFEKGIDLGLYRRYRFFYVTDRTVTPTLPTVFGSGYTGVKMAFPSRGIDTNCKVRMTGGGWASSHTYPAKITFIKDSAELRSINHKDNDEKHLTVGFRETVSTAISKISEIEQKIDNINFVLGVEKQEYTTFSSELPVPTDVTNQDTTQILLASSRCVSGKVRKIEIPYVKGKGTTGYLAVQIINAGESANAAKTLEETYFSTNTVTQTNGQSGNSTFYFDNLFIPSDFYAIRFSFVPNKETIPEYGGNNCLTYAIRLVSITESDYNNPVYNHDGYKVFNPATQGYGYSTVDYGVVVTVESVKSSFDSIIKDLYTLKKTIS